MLQHQELSREAITRAGKLYEEFDGITLLPTNRDIYEGFIKAYTNFMKTMMGNDATGAVVTKQYNALIECTQKLLSHYVDVSLSCRTYTLSRLHFEEIERKYLSNLEKHKSVEDLSIVELYQKLKMDYTNCVEPDAELVTQLEEKVNALMEQYIA